MMDKEMLKDSFIKLNDMYKSMIEIHENLRKELLPSDFVNIGSYSLASKGDLFCTVAELHKVLNDYDVDI